MFYGSEFSWNSSKKNRRINFAGGIFTNLSHDHLDYHETFAEYRDVKKVFFDSLPKTAFALLILMIKMALYVAKYKS